MSKNTRKIAVTYALPYANGSLHLGHLVGFIQADIWVRFQKMQGAECTFVSGCDGHGTPIMIQAEKQHLAPELMIEQIREEHQQDLAGFLIDLDNYHTTHSSENEGWVQRVFESHEQAGNIVKHTIRQAYDPEKKMFLPDRYIKGECPRCGAMDQYGDNCEHCGATYAPTDLKNAYSTLSGAKPIEKESEHHFFKLQNYSDLLHEWTRSGHLQEQVTNKLDEWFKTGLKEWDISRDTPYFGFKIPNTTDKYFYCWLDAPIGYIASFDNLCKRRQDLDLNEYWSKNSKTELYQFIGKDIMYFHTLFWPALLSGANLRTPTAIFCHGFLTIDGQKMSKSRGTFIKAKTYLEHINPEYFRYYLATKLSSHIEDLDIQFDDFTQRVNADVVGKFVNIASRCASFIEKQFSGILSDKLVESDLYTDFVKAGDIIAEKLEHLEFNQAIRIMMSLADRANQYIDEKKPWALIKEASRHSEVHDICTLGVNLFRILMIYMKPILPAMAQKAEIFLNISPLIWNDKNHPLLAHRIHTFSPLAQRIEKIQIDNMKQAAKEEPPMTTTEQPALPTESKNQFISIDDFSKIDLRIAKIIDAGHVDGAEKLLRLEVDLGNEKRQIFAGIKAAYAPEQLIGKLTVIVANLEPRKMRFGTSSGMVLCAGPGGQELWLISPDTGAQPGMKVK